MKRASGIVPTLSFVAGAAGVGRRGARGGPSGPHRRGHWSVAPGSGGDDDLVDFIEDDEPDRSGLASEDRPLVVLVVDDEPFVHTATVMALEGERLHGRALRFLHAYSAAEAREVIATNPDLALVLLDVVMESQDAGLRLVRVVREELRRPDLRIVIRTGQPGYAPEAYVRENFAIDGYAMKAQLTRSTLLDVIARALAPRPGDLPDEAAH